MKRLTVHLKRVNKTTEVKEGRSKSKIHNTLSFKVKDESAALKVITNINDTNHPKNNINKWYLSNIH